MKKLSDWLIRLARWYLQERHQYVVLTPEEASAERSDAYERGALNWHQHGIALGRWMERSTAKIATIKPTRQMRRKHARK